MFLDDELLLLGRNCALDLESIKECIKKMAERLGFASRYFSNLFPYIKIMYKPVICNNIFL